MVIEDNDIESVRTMLAAFKMVLNQTRAELAYWNQKQFPIAVGAWECTQGCLLDKIATLEAYLREKTETKTIPSAEKVFQPSVLIVQGKPEGEN